MSAEALSRENLSQEELEPMPMIYDVEKIADFLGYGEGSISVDSRLGSYRDPLSMDILDGVDQEIISGNILIDVDRDKSGKQIDDDGCGDGRRADRVIRSETLLKKSLNRPKVFGGGVVMTAAAKIGLGEAKTVLSKIGGEKHVPTLGKLFKKSRRDMSQAGLKFGAHSGSHRMEGTCDCGAIDKAPQIIENTIKYKKNIINSIMAIHPPTDNHDKQLQLTKIEGIFREFRHYSNELHRKDYSGAKVLLGILEEGSVVKELADDHREVAVVINTIPDKTVNQSRIRAKTNEVAQVFAVDQWRLDQIAKKIYPDDPIAADKAYYSMLVYSLSTAATLTAGDLPVYIAKKPS